MTTKVSSKIADSLKEAEELQGQVAALMDAGAGALLPPAQTSTAPALLDDVETQLEDATNQRNELQAFKDWVEMAYPEVVKDYGCVKVIEEVAHGL